MFRCTGEDDKHMVYIAKKDEDMPALDEPTTEMSGEGNVIVFKDINFSVSPGEAYKWRVDCVEGETQKRRKGATWKFTIAS